MTLTGKLKQIQAICGANYWSHRIYAELCYMACLSSTKDGAFDGRLTEAADFLIGRMSETHAIDREDAQAAEAMLADLSEEAKKYKVYCISHAHIDMNWMWGFHETASVTVDTFRTVLNLMKEYPDFTFAQSQASTYRIVEKYAPEMLDEIRQRVHEGRWEVSASTWTETDKNMPDGESLSRHLLYTKRYLGKLLDIDPDSLRLDFEPDTFGHNANVPEICRNGGVDYYYHMRANDGEPDLYRWRSKSGKELLVFRDPQGYNGDIGIRTFENIPLFCKKNGVNVYLYVYGVGDHGGGPTRNDIERLMDDRTFPLYPDVQFGTYGKFFAEIEKVRETLPVIDHELNFVFTGCYTSQSRIKMANRIAEDRAYDSEFLSAASTALTGAPSRTEQFGSAWENILFDHFHDILPGSGITETREYALGRFQDAMAGINVAANSSMGEIAGAIRLDSVPFEEDRFSTSEGGGVGFAVSHESGYRFPQTERGRGKVRALHLFNPTMYDRSEPVEVTVWDYRYDLSLAYFTDSCGNPVRSEVLVNGAGYWGHAYTKFLLDAKVPAFGYSTYILQLREYEGVGALAGTAMHVEGTCDYIGDYPVVLENEKLRAGFDPYSFALISLTDKEKDEQIVTPEKPSALFRFCRENPLRGMTAWRVGPYQSIEVLNDASRTVRMIDSGRTGMRSWVKYETAFASSRLTVTAELRTGESLLRFGIDVDWHEVGVPGSSVPQLNFTLPAAYAAADYTYDIPMGLVNRGDLPHDVPANSFMRMNRAGEGRSLFLVADTKYGFRGHENSASVTLIRASYDPDRYPERGVHHIQLGVGLSEAGETKKLAAQFCHPISFRAGAKHSGGTLPMDGSLFAFTEDKSDTLMVSGVKNGEDGGLILRLSDFGGTSGKVELVLSEAIPAPTSAELVDITERNGIGTASLDGRKVSFELAPYSMATLRIR